MPAPLAALVATNIAPLAGILLLGWSPIAVLVLYFVDTMLGLGVVLLLVMMHITGNAQGRPLSGFGDWMQGTFALIFVGAIFALPMSLPLWVIGPENIVAEFERPDHGLVYGILMQTAMSALAAVRMHRMLKATEDDDRILARRGLFLAARWFTLFAAMSFGLLDLLGARWGAFVLILIYGGASVYFELFPESAQRWLRGAKPIKYQPDLDGPPAGTPAGSAEVAPRPANPNTPARPRRRKRH